VTWSPGGAISFVQYDKALEARLRNKRSMEPIWRAAGGMAKARSFAMRRGCGVMRCARWDCPQRSKAHLMIRRHSLSILPRSGAMSWDEPFVLVIPP
jgi:hypothetical protein